MKDTMDYIGKLVESGLFDGERIRLAKKRQVAVFKGEKPDKWPALLWKWELDQTQEKIPTPNLKEAFYDSDLMLCSQVRSAICAANARSDIVPSIRANMGCATILSCLGLEQEIFEDKMPWLSQHLTKEQISKLTPDDIKIQGTFELGIKHMRRFREVCGDRLPTYCMDTQGPFDLAHLIIGDDLFYLLYDDPPFVHHLMNLCLELGVKAHRWMKELTGEPDTISCHSNMLYSENFGIRICEDTTAIVGEEIIREFAMPYTQRLAAEFGGAWVHYCGRNDTLTQALCEIREVKALNFGLMPEGKQDHDFEKDMELMKKYGKVHIGDWRKYESESGKKYLKRLHHWASQGCIIPNIQSADGGHEPFKDNESVLNFWYSL